MVFGKGAKWLKYILYIFFLFSHYDEQYSS